MSGKEKTNPSKRKEPTPDSGVGTFVFRNREWSTSKLTREFFALRKRRDELLEEKKTSRLSSEKWEELKSVWEDLEYIGPEVERREKNKRNVERSAERKSSARKTSNGRGGSESRRDRQADVSGSDPSGDEELIGISENLADALFPEDGKKTFLDAETQGLVTELMKIRSTVRTVQKQIGKRKKQGKPLEKDFGRLSQKRERREQIVSRLQESYERLQAELAAAKAALSELPDGTQRRKALQTEFDLSNAVKELGSIIGRGSREVGVDEEFLADHFDSRNEDGTGRPDDTNQGPAKSDEVVAASQPAEELGGVVEVSIGGADSVRSGDAEPTVPIRVPTITEPVAIRENNQGDDSSEPTYQDTIGKGYARKIPGGRFGEIVREIDRTKKLSKEDPEDYLSALHETREALLRERARLFEWRGKTDKDESDSQYELFLEQNVKDIEKKRMQQEADLPAVLVPEIRMARIAELNAQKNDWNLSRSEKKSRAVGRSRSFIESLKASIQELENTEADREAERVGIEAELDRGRSEHDAIMKKISEAIGSRFFSESNLREQLEREQEIPRQRLAAIATEQGKLEALRSELVREEEWLQSEGISLSVTDVKPDVISNDVDREPVFGPYVSTEKGMKSGDVIPAPEIQEPTSASDPMAPVMGNLNNPSAPRDAELDVLGNRDIPTVPEASVDVALSDTVRERFDSFGVSSSELASVGGFVELTEGQQLFVAEMLQQTAARKIEDQARDTVATKSGLLKSFTLDKSRKEAAGQVLHGGMDVYVEDLKQLVGMMKTSGLDVEHNDGKFDVRFLSMPEGFDENEKLREGSESFNRAARRFSEIPYEWSLKSASKSERKAYEEAKQAFNASKDDLEQAMFSPDRGESAKEYSNLTKEYGAIRVAENRVRLIQQLTAHPEVGEYLGTLERQNTFLAGLKSVASERFGYFVGGAAGRAALVGTLGLLAAPAVAAVSGGFMGYRRAQETLIEQDRQARRGKDVVTKAAPGDGAGWFRKLITKPEAISQEKLRAGKRQMVRASVSETESDGDGRKRGLVERLDIINERIAKLSSDDVASMNKELGALAARVEYVKNKLDSDQVNFGNGTEGIRSRVMLLEALSRAEMNLGVFAGGKDSGSVSDRFDRMFGQAQKDEDSRVKGARDAYVRYETGRGMVMAGTISLLGARVMSAAHEATAALHHVPGSGSASKHLNDIYDTKRVGMVEESSPPTAGGTESTVRRLVDPETTATGQAAQRFTGEAVESTGSRAGTASETLGRTVVEKASKAAEAIGRTYSETANRGDSVTTLARRAFAGYAKENNLSGFTPEQKVYIEDYLQKNVAPRGALRIGAKVEFTKDLLDEAIGKAKALDADQLQNLHRYAEQVREFRTESVSDQVIQSGSGEDVVTAVNAPKIPTSESALSDRVPRVPSTLVTAEDAAPPVTGGPSTEAAEAARETGNQVGTLRDMVQSDMARDFLADPNHVEPFRKAAAGTVRELFSISSGGVNEKLFLKIGKMTSKDVFGDCLLAVANPERRASMDGFDAEGVRRLGKFLIAARRAGIQPEVGIGKTETFRVYIERVSVRLAERGMDPSMLIASVSDRDLDGFADRALETWRNKDS
ncbi:MAG: hypothetical protein HGA33_04275 [Candidatus Moranbacteria bacterium]|nr:hypothetical protein [Candidatus Moranbacteria bacterium]